MADRLHWLALIAAAVVPATALAQRPSEPIMPGLPIKQGDQNAVGIAVPPGAAGRQSRREASRSTL